MLKLPFWVTLFFYNLLEVSVDIQKCIHAVLIIIFLSFSTNALTADMWRNPAPYPEGMDTWFGSINNKTAQHDYRNRVGGWGDQYSSLLRFNLSGLPQLATNVLVWRYTINEGASTSINWWKINGQWQSNAVAYSNFPWGTLSYLGKTSTPSPGYWYTTNITSIYNQWRTGSVSTLNYGLILTPVNTNNYYSSFYSSAQGGGYGPWLQVTYTPQSNDSVIKLKWPLSTAYASRVVTQTYGIDWAGGVYCNGLIEKHNGVDYSAAAGTTVYAPEDGWVKHVELHTGWAYHIVLEHNHPINGKFTTVLWHVTPLSGIADGVFVPKGMKIATVANLGGATHFHFGIRSGAYTKTISGTGALPQTSCNGLPAFPEKFMNPSVVLFQ
jgi:murein DD-endopeptidase MepM/ murein hydrolase activator NlpD